MIRVLSILGILGLLTVSAVASCAATRSVGPPARDPKNQTCTACKGASDCGGDDECFSGCCRTLDDENPLE